MHSSNGGECTNDESRKGNPITISQDEGDLVKETPHVAAEPQCQHAAFKEQGCQSDLTRGIGCPVGSELEHTPEPAGRSRVGFGCRNVMLDKHASKTGAPRQVRRAPQNSQLFAYSQKAAKPINPALHQDWICLMNAHLRLSHNMSALQIMYSQKIEKG